MIKTSIRFFDNIPVRAVWDDETSRWWLCAVDIAEALTNTKNPRVYWATVKRRNPQLIAICKQLKLMAKDEKMYLTDVIDDDGVNSFINSFGIVACACPPTSRHRRKKRKARQKPCKSRHWRGRNHSQGERMESAACLRYGISPKASMESTAGGRESRPKGRGDTQQAVMPYA